MLSWLVKSSLAMLLEPVDPPVCGVSGNPKPLSKIGNGVVIEKVILEDALSLFDHVNTFQDPTSSWRKCYPCLSNFLKPMSRFGSNMRLLT